MATTTATTTTSLKLLVNKDTGKVLFAEAGKDFVDFLFGLLELPLGSIMFLVVEYGNARNGSSFGKIYQSVQNLNNTYLQQNQLTKDSLLRPKSASSSNRHTPLFQAFQQFAYLFDVESTTTTASATYGNEIPSGLCSHTCKGRMVGTVSSHQRKKWKKNRNRKTSSFHGHTTTIYSDNPIPSLYNGHTTNCGNTDPEGYVKGVVTYMVMDDLEVKPMSNISIITVLNTFDVKHVGCLQEKIVKVDMGKGLELVNASFKSTTVLTDIFLRKKGSMNGPSDPAGWLEITSNI